MNIERITESRLFYLSEERQSVALKLTEWHVICGIRAESGECGDFKRNERETELKRTLSVYPTFNQAKLKTLYI